MRVVIKISNLKSQADITNIRTALSQEEGVLACHIKRERGEVDIVFDDYFIKLQEIQDLLEELGYTVI